MTDSCDAGVSLGRVVADGASVGESVAGVTGWSDGDAVGVVLRTTARTAAVAV
jgi:hypothetical protein